MKTFIAQLPVNSDAHTGAPKMAQHISSTLSRQRCDMPVRRLLALALALASAGACNEALADTPVVTNITYDLGNNVTSVKDPRGLTTSYEYDGFGQMWQVSSPDTGVTASAYDSYGRKSSMTRADGTTTTYTYDGINRPTSVNAGGLAQQLSYDSCTNGLGRVCSASDATGSNSYSYTPQGQVSGRGFSVNGTVYSLGYSYDPEGKIAAIAYPDGNAATYTYSNGVVSNVSVTVSGVVSNIASAVDYAPANLAMSSWTSSNGLANVMAYDNDMRISSISVPGVQSLSFGYDYADRISVITNGINSAMTQGITYDSMSRVSSVASSADNESYLYDANGNRTSQTVNGQSLSLTISPTSNQVTQVSGSENEQYGYDALGDLATVSSVPMFTYNAFNRMNSAPGASYYVGPEGQRLYKLVGSTATYFAPSYNGPLLAETSSGQWSDYVWLNGRLVGLVSAGQLYAIHDDQVGRPEEMTNASATVVWRAENFAFTREVTLSSGPTLNLGFPGQYFDQETGNWNNGFRDYYDALGRYLESDPAGLSAGVNTYTYADGNPVTLNDPTGLNPGSVFSSMGCAAVDMLNYIIANSSTSGGAQFPSNAEVANYITTTAGGYTYSNNFTVGGSASVNPGPAPSNFAATFHTHTLVPWPAGNANLNFSMPGQISSEPNGGDLSAANQAAYGPQFVGSIQMAGVDAQGNVVGAPVIHYNSGQGSSTSLISAANCNCH